MGIWLNKNTPDEVFTRTHSRRPVTARPRYNQNTGSGFIITLIAVFAILGVVAFIAISNATGGDISCLFAKDTVGCLIITGNQ